MQKEREKLEIRNREIDDLFLNLYTDKTKGILSEQRFLKLASAMEQEQQANQNRLRDLMQLMRQSASRKRMCKPLFRRFGSTLPFKNWMKWCCTCS